MLTFTYLVDEYRTLLRLITHVGLKTLWIPRPNIPRLLRFRAEPKHVWLLVESVAILNAWQPLRNKIAISFPRAKGVKGGTLWEIVRI